MKKNDIEISSQLLEVSKNFVGKVGDTGSLKKLLFMAVIAWNISIQHPGDERVQIQSFIKKYRFEYPDMGDLILLKLEEDMVSMANARKELYPEILSLIKDLDVKPQPDGSNYIEVSAVRPTV